MLPLTAGVWTRRLFIASCVLGPLISFCDPRAAVADEGGVSVWLPGFFGSLAAVSQQPGWSLTSIYYHTSVSASGDVAFARQVTAGGFTGTAKGTIAAQLDAQGDLGLFAPNYVFATPVLGGQASLGVLTVVGRSAASGDAALSASVGGVPVTKVYSASDQVTGFGDLLAMGSLRWNWGVHNLMVYGMTGIPVGAYDAMRLANLGTGHWSNDAGIGYTYFDSKRGHEFSAVSGWTYNYVNPSTDYQNGIDWHLDWGASQFLSKQLQIGLVGYIYQQLTPDRGQAPILGNFESRVFGVGPQIGYIIPLGASQGYLNLKGYREFDARYRPEGWNVWLTFALSPAPPVSSK